jgi:hypothetical protein
MRTTGWYLKGEACMNEIMEDEFINENFEKESRPKLIPITYERKAMITVTQATRTTLIATTRQVSFAVRTSEEFWVSQIISGMGDELQSARSSVRHMHLLFRGHFVAE